MGTPHNQPPSSTPVPSNLYAMILWILQRPGTIPLSLGVVVALAGWTLQEHFPLQPSAQYGDEAFIAGAVLAVIGLLWLQFRPKAVSTLVDRSALDFVSDAYLGRKQDEASLGKLIRNHPLVFLSGESGAGKSTLLKRGIVENLRAAEKYVPVLIDYWGPDWETDVRSTVARELADAMGQSSPIDDPIRWLSRQSSGGRLPVLLFDQFDDYITRHHAKFVPESDRRIVTALEVRRLNSFWNDIANLIERGAIHCVFAARRDMDWGLRCVSFCPAETYLLSRLGSDVSDQLLNEITKTGAITHPDGTWVPLKDRLQRELERDGVLAIRMRLALQGLPKTLSLRAYENAGGLIGLEADHIRRQAEECARIAGLPSAAVRSVLLAMTTREGPKTIVRIESELLKSTGERRCTETQLADALRFLAHKEIVRRRVNYETSSAVWQLDHDYLSNGVIELDRRDNRWRYVLGERARAFASAGSWRGKLASRLTAWEQARIVWEVLQRRLAYPPHQRFALVSLLCVLLGPWLPLSLGGLYAVSWFARLTTASALYSEIGNTLSTTPREAEALWTISESSPRVRLAVVSVAVDEPGGALRFTRRGMVMRANWEYFGSGLLTNEAHDSMHGGNVLTAAIGLQESQRAAIWKKVVVGQCASGGLDAGQKRACAEIAFRLRVDSLVTWQRILDATVSTTDSRQLAMLATNLETVSDSLTEMDTYQAARMTIAEMQGIERPDQLGTLGRALGALEPHFDDSLGKVAVQLITAAIPRARYIGGQRSLLLGLKALEHHLSAFDASQAARVIVRSMRSGSGTPRLAYLAESLGVLDGHVSDQQLQSAVRLVIKSIDTADHFAQQGALAVGLGELGAGLSERDAASVAAELTAAIRQSSDWHAVDELASGLRAISGRVSPDNARKLSHILSVDLRESRSPEIITYLARGLGALAPSIGGEHLGVAASRLLDIVRDARTSDDYFRIARALKAIGTDLPERDAERLGASLISAMGRVNSPKLLNYLAHALGALREHIPYSMRTKAVQRLLAAMTQESDAAELGTLAQGLFEVRDSLSVRDADACAHLLVAAIRRANDSEKLDSLAENLSWIGPYLSDGAASDAFLAAVKEIRRSPTPFCRTLVPLVRPEQIPMVVEDVLKWPTCAQADRLRLSERIGKLSAPSGEFGCKVPSGKQQCTPGFWDFVDWARNQGYRLEDPAPRPAGILEVKESILPYFDPL